MLHRILAALAALCLFGTHLPVRAEAPEAPDAFFDRLFEGYRTQGAAVHIVWGGRILYSRYYGSLDRAGRFPVKADSLFRVASVTKMVSALGVMKLVEEGRLALDDDVGNVLGFPLRNPRYPDVPITVRQLLCHTTSLKATGSYTRATKPLSEQFNPSLFSGHAPGTHYEYSNLNGGILGALIEKVSGRSLNDYMTEAVFAPLGVEATYNLKLLDGIDESRVSPEYNTDLTIAQSVNSILKSVENRGNSVDPLNHFNLTIGSLWIDPAGLAKIMAMLQAGGVYQGVRVLEEATVAQMMADPSLAPGSSVTLSGGSYGLGMQRQSFGALGTWWGHQGRVRGQVCNAYCQKETGLCLVMCVNGQRVKLTDNVSRCALRAVEQVEAWYQDGTLSLMVGVK